MTVPNFAAFIRIAFVSLLLAGPNNAAAETYLYMAEEDGCFWCGRWDKEISAIYPKTTEGEAAPLRRFDLHGPMPKDVALKSKVRFTPTFILVKDGTEVGRIEGYPGEDFFWPLLGELISSSIEKSSG